jgi:hypothetical protein
MKTTLSQREADEQAVRAQQIVTMTSLFFTGQEPGVIGSALAELMATFLTNHKIPQNVAAEADLRAEILRTWCETVWELVAVNEGRSETKQ